MKDLIWQIVTPIAKFPIYVIISSAREWTLAHNRGLSVLLLTMNSSELDNALFTPSPRGVTLFIKQTAAEFIRPYDHRV